MKAVFTYKLEDWEVAHIKLIDNELYYEEDKIGYIISEKPDMNLVWLAMQIVSYHILDSVDVDNLKLINLDYPELDNYRQNQKEKERAVLETLGGKEEKSK